MPATRYVNPNPRQSEFKYTLSLLAQPQVIVVLMALVIFLLLVALVG